MYQCSLDNLVIRTIGTDDILNSTKEKQEREALGNPHFISDMAEWVAQFQLRAVIYSLSSLPSGSLRDGFGDRQVALKIHRHILLGFHSQGMQEDSLRNGDTGLLDHVNKWQCGKWPGKLTTFRIRKLL